MWVSFIAVHLLPISLKVSLWLRKEEVLETDCIHCRFVDADWGRSDRGKNPDWVQDLFLCTPLPMPTYLVQEMEKEIERGKELRLCTRSTRRWAIRQYLQGRTREGYVWQGISLIPVGRQKGNTTVELGLGWHRFHKRSRPPFPVFLHPLSILESDIAGCWNGTGVPLAAEHRERPD